MAFPYHVFTSIQWIGLRENLQESPMILMGKSMVSCRFSLKPIHWSIPWLHWLRRDTRHSLATHQVTASNISISAQHSMEAAVLRCITVHKSIHKKRIMILCVYIYCVYYIYILYTWHIYIYIYSIICRCIYGYTWWSFQTENGFKQQEWIWCKVCKTEILPQRCS